MISGIALLSAGVLAFADLSNRIDLVDQTVTGFKPLDLSPLDSRIRELERISHPRPDTSDRDSRITALETSFNVSLSPLDGRIRALEANDHDLPDLTPLISRIVKLEGGFDFEILTRSIPDVRSTMEPVYIPVTASYKVIAAGWDIPGGQGSEDIFIRKSMPSNDQSSWEFIIQNTTNANPNLRVLLYVVCVRTP